MALPNSTIEATPTLRSDHIRGLEKLLHEMEVHFTDHAALLAEHRYALSKADQALLASCVQRQQMTAIRLSELEDQRASLLRMIYGPRVNTAGLTLTELARRCGPEHAPRLMAHATRLRTLMAQCVERQQVIAVASKNLMGHVSSLVRQIGRHLSDTGTYARSSSAPTPTAPGGLDLVS